MKHPNGEQLLRYADGELAAREIPAVRAHLEACWQCRMELAEFHKTINECVRYRKNVLQTHLPSPPAPWGDIQRKFTEADASLGRPSIFTQWRAAVSGLILGPRKWAAASLLLGVIVVAATLRFRSDQPLLQPGPSPTEQRLNAASSEIPKQAIPAAPALSAPTGPNTPSEGALPATMPAATAADELRVFVALHLVGADLGEPVQVTRSEGRIHVSGLGIEPGRQSRILAALSAIPNLDIRFTEAASGAQQIADFAPAGTVSSAASKSGFQEQILRQLGTRAAFEHFSNQVFERSENVMARAHAIRRLAQRFPVEVEYGMSSGERQMLLDLRRQHLGMLDRESDELRRAAQSAVPAATIPEPPQSRPASWQSAAEELFLSSRQVERSLAIALGASPGEMTADRLFTDVAQLKGSIEANRRLTAQE
jgi:hypothetical protein